MANTRSLRLALGLVCAGLLIGARASADLVSRDVGTPAVEGSTRIDRGVCTIEVGGQDIWDTRDEFRFVSLEVSGDFEAVARLVSLQPVHEWTKAGVMVRQSAAASAPHAFAAVTPQNGTVFQWRLTAGAQTLPDGGGTPYSALPLYLKLVRNGNRFSSYRSTDGNKWEENRSQNQAAEIAVAMADPVLVGLAVTSHQPGTKTTAVFDEFTIDGRSAFGTRVAVADKVANPGGEVGVSLTIDAAESVHGFACDVAFDPSILLAVGVKEGPFLSRDGADATTWQAPEIDNEKGAIRGIRCRRTVADGVQAAGILATVTFAAKEEGRTDVRLEKIDLKTPEGEEIDALVGHGRITVYPHGNISGRVVNDATGRPLAGAKVQVLRNNFALDMHAISGPDGTFTLEGVPVGTFDVAASKGESVAQTVSSVRVRRGKTTADLTIRVLRSVTPEEITLPGPVAAGEPAPAFSLANLDGNAVALADVKGKPIVLNFWESTSKACRELAPALNELAKTYEDDGLVVMGVNKEIDRAAAARYAKSEMAYPALLGGDEAFEAYGVWALPCTYLIDRAGKVRACELGCSSDAKARIATVVEEMLQEN